MNTKSALSYISEATGKRKDKASGTIQQILTLMNNSRLTPQEIEAVRDRFIEIINGYLKETVQ
jgi:hypothetical protein